MNATSPRGQPCRPSLQAGWGSSHPGVRRASAALTGFGGAAEARSVD